MKRIRFTSDYDPELLRDLFEMPDKARIISSRHKEIKQSLRFEKESKKQYV